MVSCNNCKKDFEVKVRTRQLDNDAKEIFFNCPECNERYTAYYSNDKIKKLQEKLIYWSRRNGKAATCIKWQEDVEEEMNRLKEIYSTQ